MFILLFLELFFSLEKNNISSFVFFMNELNHHFYQFFINKPKLLNYLTIIDKVMKKNTFKHSLLNLFFNEK